MDTNTRTKKHQGFVILGTDFANNYGFPVWGCCAFEFHGYEISMSTGACNSSKDSYPTCLTPMLVTNLSTSEKYDIAGTVQDAIEFVLNKIKD